MPAVTVADTTALPRVPLPAPVPSIGDHIGGVDVNPPGAGTHDQGAEFARPVFK